MIARVWHGYTTVDNADAYQAMLTPELLPGLHSKAGFRGSYLLRRNPDRAPVASDAQAGGTPATAEVSFITIILWESLDHLKALTGPDYQKAVVPDERRCVLTRWDALASHYEVVETVTAARAASLPLGR